MDVEKVDTSQTIETWTDGPRRETPETRWSLIFACEQSKDDKSATEARPGDGGTVCDAPYGDRRCEEGTESASEYPNVCQSKNTVSVIVRTLASRETPADATAVCATAEPADVICDNPTAAKHTEKVITTKVTINSLTVTFKEAMVAEGFFKGY